MVVDSGYPKDVGVTANSNWQPLGTSEYVYSSFLAPVSCFGSAIAVRACELENAKDPAEVPEGSRVLKVRQLCCGPPITSKPRSSHTGRLGLA